MRPATIKKLMQLDKLELLLWIATCSLPKVNGERRAVIEHLLGVLLTTKTNGASNKRVSRKEIELLFRECLTDTDKYIDSFSKDQFLFSFILGYLTVRGEAFPWQLAQAAIERYDQHEEWMNSKLGFNIQDAVEFSKMIKEEIIRREIKFFPPTFPSFRKDQYYNPRYVYIPDRACTFFWKTVVNFSIENLKSKIEPSKHKKLERYLERMSIDLEKRQEQSLLNIGDYNPLVGRPFVKIRQEYILPLPSMLWRALPNTFHYDLLADPAYRGRYISSKGKVAENRAKVCFAKIFDENCVRTRVKYSKAEGWPDADILIDDDEVTITVECTSKWITQQSKKGFADSITKDLRESIQKCSNQLLRAQNAIITGEIKTKKTGKILQIIIVDDYIPGLENILHASSLVKALRPYIISTYDLDIITDLTSKSEFVKFVSQRIEVSEKGVMFGADELDYYVFFKLYGFSEYIDKIKENISILQYIGHIEKIAPTYYGEKMRAFINNYQLETLIGAENLELLEGWS